MSAGVSSPQAVGLAAGLTESVLGDDAVLDDRDALFATVLLAEDDADGLDDELYAAATRNTTTAKVSGQWRFEL